MSSAKYDNDAIDLNTPYEENEIRLKGIIGFGIGLVLLIVITFALMWALLSKLKDYYYVPPSNPMAMSEREKLPPEPRLQLAPGFGVDSEKGRVNLELMPPGAEYQQMRRQWEQVWKHGNKDEKTGVTTILPIEEAKQRLLSQNVKAKAGDDAAQLYDSSRAFVSDSSAGRLASEKRR